MNVGAHPLVVAVALGLLGPNALTAVGRPPAPCEGEREADPVDEGVLRDGEDAAPGEEDPLSVDRVEAIWTEMQR